MASTILSKRAGQLFPLCRPRRPMIKFFLSALLCLLGSFATAAQYDQVAALMLRDIDVSAPVSARQLDGLLGRHIDIVRDAEFSQCTSNFEVHFKGAGHDGFFEIYPEDNAVRDFEALQNKRLSETARLKGRLWLTLDSRQLARFPIRLGPLALTPDFTLSTFKHAYPRSARLGNPEEIEGQGKFTAYALILGKPGSNTRIDDDGLPYVAHIRLLFRGAILQKIVIHQGVAC